MPLGLTDSPWNNNANIDLYVRMQTNSPQDDTKVKMPHKLWKQEDAIPKPINPITDNWLQH